ncbi:MAG TPA: CpsB/CapC family capsule biosynthesis tyrosine phosphatase [Myxococcaceae bacterium]|jgi:protein-tyrosine phosphatase|nr:CpsB/CapC family capsule biosynthesis tyrosine phosphatase [Myxococcaceae bacterium]
MSGYVDLHCHLLPGVDDGARTPADALEMARALVDIGVSTVAVSPHARAGCAPVEVCVERLAALRGSLAEAGVPLTLELGAENALVEDGFLEGLGTPRARPVHRGPHVLVELPYSAPVPALPSLVFQMMRKGVVPLLAHPERCLELQRPGRAAEVVALGARLQLDLGALSGRYGPVARRTARALLDAGLYAVAATDLHAPAGARRWLERALSELRACAGESAVERLFRDAPARVLAGETVEMPDAGRVDGGTQ